jgi:hypothetical protein
MLLHVVRALLDGVISKCRRNDASWSLKNENCLAFCQEIRPTLSAPSPAPLPTSSHSIHPLPSSSRPRAAPLHRRSPAPAHPVPSSCPPNCSHAFLASRTRWLRLGLAGRCTNRSSLAARLQAPATSKVAVNGGPPPRCPRAHPTLAPRRALS